MRGRGEGSIYKDRRGRWVTAIPLGYNPKNGRRRRKIFISATYKDALIKLKSYKRGEGLPTDDIKTLGAWLHRPTFFTLPKFLLKLIFGEMSTLLIDGQKVLPQALLNADFKFKQPTLKQALE